MFFRTLVSKRPSWSKPSSGTVRQWRLWEQAARRQHPVQWFFRETLWQNLVSRNFRSLKHRGSTVKWALLHRLHPAHRHHVVRTGLRPGYHDVREQHLHALFESFARFFERQTGPKGHVDWQADAAHARVFEEMQALYTWWTVERPKRLSAQNALLAYEFRDPALNENFLAVFDEDYQTHPEVLAWQERSDQSSAAERLGEEEDQRMLHRLVDIRLSLWD